MIVFVFINKELGGYPYGLLDLPQILRTLNGSISEKLVHTFLQKLSWGGYGSDHDLN